jgi:Rrf2 family protein
VQTTETADLALGPHGRLALAAAVYLAGKPYDLTSASALARRLGAPTRHVRRTLRSLAAAGLVEGASGFGGGYRLTRPAADISLLELVEAGGGSLRTAGCILGGGPCDGTCDVHPAWWAAQDALRGVLAQMPLARVLA